MEKILDLIIVGAGPAGIYAGHLAKEANLNYIVLEASSEVGGQVLLYKDKPIYDMPGHVDILGEALVDALLKQATLSHELKRIHLNEEVLEVSLIDQLFQVITSREKYRSKFVLLTHGGGMMLPKTMGLLHEEATKNISYHVSDPSLYVNQKLILFGGGDSALDWAHYFMNQNTDVTLIHRRHDFRGDERLLSKLKKNIVIKTPYKASSLNINNEMVQSVIIENLETKASEEIQCDHILVFFGSVPKPHQLLLEGVLKKGHKLKVHTTMETSLKGLYASGNGITYEGKLNMITTSLGETATAVGNIIESLYPEKTKSYQKK
jgi:ferredoxin/flavodoxin---NADP+ reductase